MIADLMKRKKARPRPNTVHLGSLNYLFTMCRFP